MFGTRPALNNLAVTPGNEYYVQLDGFGGDFGIGTITVSGVPGCPGDLDADNEVGINDFLDLLAAWGVCPNPDVCPADLDDNGIVGITDFLMLLAAWGPCQPG